MNIYTGNMVWRYSTNIQWAKAYYEHDSTHFDFNLLYYLQMVLNELGVW